jgi:ligand-binding sensor domain-containing protein/signal transduction histidine kinase
MVQIMKTWHVLFIAIIGIGFSCTSKQENRVRDTPTSIDTLAPPQVTVLADLPDSLQPKMVYVDKMPAPEVVAVSNEATVMNTTGGKFNFTNFNTDNGLASDDILCLMVDKTGNLWFGTTNGVSKYDGKSFANFTTDQGLINNGVLAITEDSSGNLWFATNVGVSKYDGKAFSNFTTDQGLANNDVWDIEVDKAGNLWFATGGGVSKYDGKSFTHLTTANGLLSNRVSSIIEDRAGNLWFATGGGVSKYDGKSFTHLSTANGLLSNRVWSIMEDRAGNLWFGTTAGLSKYDGNTFTNFTTAHGLPGNNVWRVFEDRTGNLWFGTLSNGVSKYDGKSFTNFTTEQGLVNNQVMSIAEDEKGNIWFSTLGDGVCRYDGEAFIIFTTEQGLANSVVHSITEDKTGNLWFGTSGNGVSKYDGKSLPAGQAGFTNFTTAQGLVHNAINGITEDKDGNLWFGTQEGLSKYNGKSITNLTTAQGLPDNFIKGITEDKDGNLWIYTSKGLSKYNGKSFTNFTTAQGLAHNFILGVTEDKDGNLWFGTQEGLSKYNGKSITNFTTAQGLPHNRVLSITEDKTGNLWLGTPEGLSVMRTGSKQLIQNFTIVDGLPDKYVHKVFQMPDGKMGVATKSGIIFFKVSEDFSTLTDIELFDANADYPVKNLNGSTNSVYLDSKGTIWAGTRSEKRGLVRFDYAALRKHTAPPTLVIQSIKVKDEPINWYHLLTQGERNTKEDSATALLQEYLAYGKTLSTTESDSILKRFGNIRFDGISRFNPLPENLVLPYKHNQVGFEFVAIETDRPQLVKYQYMLEGYDKKWSAVTSKSYANFGNISEGKYTFKVKAQGSNGVWSEPITYAFKVLPPWYRSWWAYMLYIVLFASGIFLFIRWRTKALQKEKIQLEEKVTLRTTELNQSLEHLKATQAQLIQSEKMASLGELTAGIAHEIQNPLNFVNNFSEVSNELMDEMNEELDKGDIEEAKAISADIKQNLEKITHHGKRADAIVKGMLAHSRSSSGEKIPTDINALADEYLRLSYHGLRARDKTFNADFKTDFDPNLPKVNVVPQDIGRVLLNLINNAFQATNELSKAHDSYRGEPLEGFKPLVTVTTKLWEGSPLSLSRDLGRAGGSERKWVLNLHLRQRPRHTLLHQRQNIPTFFHY